MAPDTPPARKPLVNRSASVKLGKKLSPTFASTAQRLAREGRPPTDHATRMYGVKHG